MVRVGDGRFAGLRFKGVWKVKFFRKLKKSCVSVTFRVKNFNCFPDTLMFCVKTVKYSVLDVKYVPEHVERRNCRMSKILKTKLSKV